MSFAVKSFSVLRICSFGGPLLNTHSLTKASLTLEAEIDVRGTSLVSFVNMLLINIRYGSHGQSQLTLQVHKWQLSTKMPTQGRCVPFLNSWRS